MLGLTLPIRNYNFFWLPNEIKDSCKHAQDMLYVEERNLGIPGDKMARYSSYPLRWQTRHRIQKPLTLDMLRDASALYAHTQIVLLVDEKTVHILRTCTFQTSSDGREWVGPYWLLVPVYLQTTLSGKLACVLVDLKRMEINF
jgi:hypothetical protein